MAQDEEDRETAATPSVVPTISSTRLHFTIVGLWLCLFMSAMDTTIVATALIKISGSFNALDQAAWLVTAYLLTYNSFLMLTAKLSDIFGLRSVLLTFTVVFFVFSMACAGAKSMNQLIVFRAFQGIGGSALYSLVFVAIVKLVVPEKMGFYSGVISSVFALANLLGPLLGGAITDHTSWRWIFWINGPIVGTAFAILFAAMPGLNDGKSTRERVQGFDGVGNILSVVWPIPLLFALQEAGAQYEWKSGVIIGTLVTGIVLFLLFGFYEAWISYKTKIDATFPIRFLTKPSTALLLLSMLLLGMPFYVMFIQVPQRFQGVNFTSAQRSGILLLPVSLTTPVGAIVGGALMNKKLAAEWLLIISSAVVCIGVGLMSSLPVTSHISHATYAYEVITGIGLGLQSTVYYMLLYTSVEEKDVTMGTGTLNMMRTLGGAVAVAICSALHHSVLQSGLSGFLSAEEVAHVQESSAYIAQLPQQARQELGRVFGRSYNKQFQVMLAFTLLNFLVGILLAIIRKRDGVFGAMPERKEGNEFLKVVKKEEARTSLRASSEAQDQAGPDEGARHREGKSAERKANKVSAIAPNQEEDGEKRLEG